ncbi:MAG: TRAP transporter substrate-binding protein DctP [Acetobacterales bacterium]
MQKLLAAAVLSTCCAIAMPSQADVSLVYNNAFNKTDTQTGVIADLWIDRIQDATDGRVKIRHVPGGALLKAEGTLEGVRKGVADAGAVTLVYHIGELPISSALAGSFDVVYGNMLDLPGVIAITRKLYEEFPEFQAEYEALGVKPLVFVPAGQYSMIGTAKIASVDDFKDKKIRAFGSSLPKFIESVGGVPMAVAFGEMYTSLQTGVIDSVITNPTAMIPAGLHEVSKFAVTTGPGLGTSMAGATIAYTIRLQSWNKIPEKDQRLIERVSATMEPIGAHVMTEGTAATYRGLKEKGVEVLHLSSDDVDRIAKMAPDFFAEEEKRLNGRGLPGTRIFARYRELAEAYADGAWKPWKIE